MSAVTGALLCELDELSFSRAIHSFKMYRLVYIFSLGNRLTSENTNFLPLLSDRMNINVVRTLGMQEKTKSVALQGRNPSTKGCVCAGEQRVPLPSEVRQQLTSLYRVGYLCAAGACAVFAPLRECRLP